MVGEKVVVCGRDDEIKAKIRAEEEVVQEDF